MVADFFKKQKGESAGNKLAFQIVGVLFIIIIAALIVSDIKMYNRKKELVAQINSYKKQIADIQKNSQNLQAEIANSSNKDYIEKIAYEQLGEQKPGETEYIFTSPKNKPSAAPKNASNSGSYFQMFWNWIKSKF